LGAGPLQTARRCPVSALCGGHRGGGSSGQGATPTTTCPAVRPLDPGAVPGE
jgi:hypothetical protein